MTGDARADPGPAARVRARRDPDAAVHPAAAALRVRQADPRGGPESHMVKWGTPTMGGLLIILVVLGRLPPAAVAAPGRRHRPDRDARARRASWAPSTTTSTPGPGRGSGPPEAPVADRRGAVRRWQIQSTYQITGIRVPFVGDVSVEPLVYVLFGAFAIVAASNGVNITDGLDGLAGGTLVFAFVVVPDHRAAQRARPSRNVAFLCALIIGALLGFLWFNVHPAQIFMGDSGLAVPGGDARRHRADHRPDPRAAPDRADLRDRDRRR